MQSTDAVEIFLQGAEVVAAALADPAVAEAWDRPSVLEDQRVSGLAGHLARSGVLIVADYLDARPVGGPVDFTSAGHYYATLLRGSSPADHQAIRQRGAEVAAVGRDALLRTLAQRLSVLGPRLRSLEPGHLVAVTGGKVIGVQDYLTTRIVEQVVHLDDLARSTGGDQWSLPPGATELTIAVGNDIARSRSATSRSSGRSTEAAMPETSFRSSDCDGAEAGPPRLAASGSQTSARAA